MERSKLPIGIGLPDKLTQSLKSSEGVATNESDVTRQQRPTNNAVSELPVQRQKSHDTSELEEDEDESLPLPSLPGETTIHMHMCSH